MKSIFYEGRERDKKDKVFVGSPIALASYFAVRVAGTVKDEIASGSDCLN